MSGMNSKLSAIIAAVIIFAGIVTEAFAAGDTAQDKVENTVAVGAEECLDIPEEETLEVQDEYIFQVMQSAEVESSSRNNVKSEKQTENIKEETTEDAATTEETTKAEAVEEKTTEPETEAVTGAVISYSEEDYNNFLRIVEAEATGGDIKSKILVADVVINRVRSPYFPNTITEVIYQENGQQFQPIMDGRFYSVTITQTTIEAVDRALCGEDYSQGATFFAAVSSAGEGSWHARNLTRLFEYGGHVYFIL